MNRFSSLMATRRRRKKEMGKCIAAGRSFSHFGGEDHFESLED